MRFYVQLSLTSLVPWLGYGLALDLYIKKQQSYLPYGRIETIVLQVAMEAYDGASNGNRSRGGVKKANDM